MTAPKSTILFIFTSADKTLDNRPTGWYLPEAAHPYYVLKPHFNIVAASPKGGPVPVDETSVKNFTDEGSVKFNKHDPEAIELVKSTLKIKDVKAEDYVALFVVGGHGPMMDLAVDEDLAKLLKDFYTSKKPISAVCHGPAALLSVIKCGTVPTMLEGVEVTGFSNTEEKEAGLDDYVNCLPFSLEDELKKAGGKYSKAGNWEPNVKWSKGILTGQNPASAHPLGEKLKEILQSA